MGWPYQQKPPMGWPLDYDSGLADFVGAWFMPEGSGNKVFDLSGNGNTGTFVGNTHFVPGKFGPAPSFDGNGDYISVIDKNIVEGEGSFSISIWVKKAETTASDYRRIITKEGTGDDAFVLRIEETSNRISFFVYTTGGNATVSNADTTIDDTDWHHLFGVYDGSNVYLYLDLVPSSETPALTGTVLATANDLKIGSYEGNADWYGLIDIPMIWNRGFSVSEIALFYREPFCMFKDPAEVALLGAYQAAPSGVAPTGNLWGPFGGCLRGVA